MALRVPCMGKIEPATETANTVWGFSICIYSTLINNMQFLTSPSSTPKYIDTYHIGNRFPLDVHCTVYNPYAHHGLISRCLIRFYLFSKSMCIYIYIIIYIYIYTIYNIYIYMYNYLFTLFFSTSKSHSSSLASCPVLHSCLHNALWAAKEPVRMVTAAALPHNQFCTHVNTVPCEPHKSQHAWSRQQPCLIISFACQHSALWAP